MTKCMPEGFRLDDDYFLFKLFYYILIRFVLPVKEIFSWIEPYVSETEKFAPGGDKEQMYILFVPLFLLFNFLSSSFSSTFFLFFGCYFDLYSIVVLIWLIMGLYMFVLMLDFHALQPYTEGRYRYIYVPIFHYNLHNSTSYVVPWAHS